jgi:hypothetical protein
VRQWSLSAKVAITSAFEKPKAINYVHWRQVRQPHASPSLVHRIGFVVRKGFFGPLHLGVSGLPLKTLEIEERTAQKVSARNGNEETSPSAEVTYDFGDNLEQAVEIFGAEVVFSRFKAAAIVDLQALIRRHLDSDPPKSAEEIQALATEWRPGVSTRKRKSTKEKAEDLFSQMSAEERTALLESLLNADSK